MGDESVYWKSAMKKRTTSMANGREDVHGLRGSNSLYSRLPELLVAQHDFNTILTDQI